jgi:signal peptidase II
MLVLVPVLYGMDQFTKFLVLSRIEEHEVVVVIPGFFNLVRVYNTGAAFGMLAGANALFIGLSIAALIILSVLIWKRKITGFLPSLGATLLTAGVLGNLTDRILHGHVIDFLDVILPVYGHWPAFNVADSCICAAASLFLISGFFEKDRSPDAAPAA